MLSKFSNHFRSFDLFAEPITLHLYESKRFRTRNGAILSILMLILVFFCSFDKLTAIITKSKVTIVAKDERQFTPKSLGLKNRFALTLQYTNRTMLKPSQLMNLYGLLGSYTLLENNSVLISKVEYDLIPCQYDDFPQFPPEQLQKLGINSWLCFNGSQEELITKGKFGDENYQYIQLSATKCTNDSKTKENECLSDQEILDVFQKKIYFTVYVVNCLPDLSNYDTPISYYFDTITYVLDPNLYVQKEVYFTPINIQTDQTRWFKLPSFTSNENIKNQDDFVYERNIEEFSTMMQYLFKGNNLYTSLYLRSGLINRTYSRKYVIFQDFLESFGSFLSIFFLAFKELGSIIHNKEMVKSIANTLYYLDSTEEMKLQKKSNLFQTFKSAWRSTLQCFFSKKKLSFDPSKKNNKVKKKQEIEKTVKKDTDLLNILKSLQQIEIIRKILLSPEQQTLMKHIKKPRIDERTSIFITADDAYSKIYDTRHDNEINRKILKWLDPGFLQELRRKV